MKVVLECRSGHRAEFPAEHARLTRAATPAAVTARYLSYVAACEAEGLQPLAPAAYRIVASPLTAESMERAWARMTGTRVWQGWRRGLDESLRAA